MRSPRFIVGVALVAALCGGPAYAQNCVFTGVVAAATTPVVAAEVSFPGLNAVTSTDSAGRFRFSGLTCGRHGLQVRKLGYAILRDTVDLNTSGEPSRIYSMQPGTQLDTVRTTATEIEYWTPRLREFEARRKKNVGGNFISETELRKLEQASIPSILRRIQGLGVVEYNGRSFVRSRRVGSLDGDQAIDQRPGSPRGCWVAVYLDGQMLFDGRVDQFNKPADVGQFFAVNLAGVEYYSSAGSTPMEFKTMKTNCGTLLLWTRAR